ACEGALLIVDAAQSVQAQTISNLYLALENDLTIMPILNKIDLPSANPEEVTDEIMELIGCEYEDVLRVSGKTGDGVRELLEQIVKRVPAPVGDENAPLQALVFDSIYIPFRGDEAYFKVVNRSNTNGQRIKLMATGHLLEDDHEGYLKLKQTPK